MDAINAKALEQKRRKALRSRNTEDKHVYFQGIAQARYVLRRVFRIVEDKAKEYGIDPLAHQALIQIYGSPDMGLRVKEVAEKLDISSAFASTLVKELVEKGYASRTRGGDDGRATRVAATKSGIALLHKIDGDVTMHIDYFGHQLSAAQKEQALSILMTYVGISIDA
jgi:DNA-binding MarR family transcriptional regulator